ncbi:MAG TPA: hypothetical protein PKA88_38525, partial [Polyangiaceae bacterium]|nr:hypothetical protein [Polyangiaceae bacterium]
MDPLYRACDRDPVVFFSLGRPPGKSQLAALVLAFQRLPCRILAQRVGGDHNRVFAPFDPFEGRAKFEGDETAEQSRSLADPEHVFAEIEYDAVGGQQTVDGAP